MEYISRHLEKILSEYIDSFPVILITGARQTGKSTILQHSTQKKKINYITFDDPMKQMLAEQTPDLFISSNPYPCILDEIKYVPNLFRYLKIEVDKNRTNGMYLLTGSHQFQLMNKASESLAGRIGILQLLPLSLREKEKETFSLPFIPTKEYCLERAKSIKEKKQIQNKTIWDDIFQGGYPEVVKNNLKPEFFYNSYLKTYLERDIRLLSQIENENQFLQFIMVTATRTGQILKYSDIAKEVGISEVTAKKWISLLITSGIIFLLNPFHSNIEKRLLKTPKLYFYDTGLVTYLTRWADSNALMNGTMAGAIFETFVVSEIVKSYHNMGKEPPVYFYRDKDQKEIDLLIYQNNTLYPVEIKKTTNPTQDDIKNFSVLSKFKNIKIGDGCVICNSKELSALKENILTIPVSFI